jgi:phytoene dehydrogenase-like protein
MAGMEVHNVNYVGGDVVTGSNDRRQPVFRPRAALDPYTTGIPGVYMCSAATPPGARAHGVCGYIAANSALRRLEDGARAGMGDLAAAAVYGVAVARLMGAASLQAVPGTV